MLTDARLKMPPSASLVTHVHAVELGAQLEAAEEFVHIDLAHVLMMTAQGILPKPVGSSLCNALLDLLDKDAHRLTNSDPSRGSITLQIEEFLQERCGAIGGNIQLARSRIDQNAEGMRLIDRKGLLASISSALNLASVQLARAGKDAGRIIPGYTHLQHSQPTTMGHYLNAHYWATSRNIDRMFEAYKRVDLCALGGAAHSGTSWPIDRDMTAKYLGHSGYVLNARDAGLSAIDFGAEIASVLSIFLSGMSRLASDLYYWSSSEVKLMRLSADLCGTSSMMPQKRNPISLERVRALAGEAAGWPASQLGMLHYAASTDADQAYVNNRIPGYCHETSGVAKLLSEAIAGMEVDYERMEKSASSEWSTASELADELVRKTGVSFRDAHDVAARVVRISEETQEKDVSVLLTRAVDESQIVMDLSNVQIEKTLSVQEFIDSRNSQGGTSKMAFSVLMEQANARHMEHLKVFSDIQTRIKAANVQLLNDARSLAAQ